MSKRSPVDVDYVLSSKYYEEVRAEMSMTLHIAVAKNKRFIVMDGIVVDGQMWASMTGEQ